MVVLTDVVAQVDAPDLDSSESRDRVVVKIDLTQFPSLEESRKVNKNEITECVGSMEIQLLAPSVYMVNFPSQRVRDWVLELRPWHIQKRVLVLRKWMPRMLPEVLSLDYALVWIRLWHVPLELYIVHGVGYLASALGKPLYTKYTDKASTIRLSLEYAKICVEVSVVSCLPASILVDIGNGNVVSIGVELVYVPHHCSHCLIFCHYDEKCSKKVVVGIVIAPEVCDVEGNVVGIVGSINQQAVEDAFFIEFVFIQACVQGIEPVVESGFGVAESVDVVVEGSVVCDADIIRPSIDVVACKSTKGDVSDLSGVLSQNKFETLCSIAVEQDVLVSPPRKERIDAAGVAGLLNQLKPRGKWVVKSISLRRGKSRHRVKLENFDAISNEFIQFFTEQLGTIDGHVENFSYGLLKRILGVELTNE
ncbi:hypothetical protein V6N12_044528 [Hibiscus sabdariffa]|uniref:DUF4283 domain-containing protein n=1 Tax=Hibiscus sabdariffa TaxID=183260 RepID=A0ABR2BQ27_9ROSI